MIIPVGVDGYVGKCRYIHIIKLTLSPQLLHIFNNRTRNSTLSTFLIVFLKVNNNDRLSLLIFATYLYTVKSRI